MENVDFGALQILDAMPAEETSELGQCNSACSINTWLKCYWTMLFP